MARFTGSQSKQPPVKAPVKIKWSHYELEIRGSGNQLMGLFLRLKNHCETLITIENRKQWFDLLGVLEVLK